MISDLRFEHAHCWNIAKESPFMRALWNSTTDNMFVVTVTKDERVLVHDINPAHAAVLNVSPKDLIGRYFDEFLTPEMIEPIKRNFLNCIARGEPVSYEENVVLDGVLRHWFTLLVPLPDETGALRLIFGTSREMTKLHNLADELKSANATLEERVASRTAELAEAVRKLESEMAKLKAAEENIKVLRGMLPICSICKKVRDDKGYWTQIEQYIRDHSEAEFTHSLCADCAKKHYKKYMS